VSLAIGAICAISLPFYFGRVATRWCRLSMFRSRNFSVTNLSTLLIYGALYVAGLVPTLFLIGTLGYTPSAVGLAAIPGSRFHRVLSARFGGYGQPAGTARVHDGWAGADGNRNALAGPIPATARRGY
jgi:hypothetical protein